MNAHPLVGTRVPKDPSRRRRSASTRVPLARAGLRRQLTAGPLRHQRSSRIFASRRVQRGAHRCRSPWRSQRRIPGTDYRTLPHRHTCGERYGGSVGSAGDHRQELGSHEMTAKTLKNGTPLSELSSIVRATDEEKQLLLRRAFLIRHGETEWSLSGQHTGTTDIPLTENGRNVARQLEPLLKKATFSLVLTSPLHRARQTCELTGLGAQAEVDANLIEWNYGEYEGLTPKQIHAKAPDWMLFSDGCPGGESPSQVGARVDQVIAAQVQHGHLGATMRHAGYRRRSRAGHGPLSPASCAERRPRHRVPVGRPGSRRGDVALERDQPG
jgi:Histidine phosphatase superfamily (branch 1)